MFVEVAEFAGRIDEQRVEAAFGELGSGAHVAAEHEPQSMFLESARRILAAFDVAGNDDQKGIRILRLQLLENAGEYLLLARVGAAGNYDLPVGRDPDLGKQRGHVEQRTFVEFGRVEFQVADHLDRFRPEAEFTEAGGVGLVLAADSGKLGEDRAEDEAEPFVAAIGTVREAGVHQEDGDLPFECAPQEVGPNLRLDEDDGLRMDGRQRAHDRSTEIDGVVDRGDVRGQVLLEFTHARRRGCADNDLQVGHAGLDGLDELGADVDLADADGVEPDDVPVRQGLFDLRAVFSETLPESGAPVATAPHLQEVERRAQPEKDGEQCCVNYPHSMLLRPDAVPKNPRQGPASWSSDEDVTSLRRSYSRKDRIPASEFFSGTPIFARAAAANSAEAFR